jgi:hypothetical protein
MLGVSSSLFINRVFRPNKKESNYPKVPTALLYERSDPPTLVEWGHGARKLFARPGAVAKYELLTDFKLNLDENLNRPSLKNGL